MMHGRPWGLAIVAVLTTLVPVQTASAASGVGAAAQTDAPTIAIQATVDYPYATWVPADPSNYSVANRTRDYPIDMIVIHDTESSAAQAIQEFQTAGWNGSAHYVVAADGSITQMVLEKDIAWHAGNWDYNTRAIGIEHEGYAYAYPTQYTPIEYNVSAQLAAYICSRWGVPMDRTHVIGHSEVPDPNNPGLYGGEDHHTDPGPYWDWNNYMSQAQYYASRMPSPPHLMLPYVVPTNGGATISWSPRTCHTPVASYQVTAQPGNISMSLPGTATSATLTGLVNGTSYTITVTATNADGSDSLTYTVIPSPPCATPTLTAAPTSGATGTGSTFTARTATCTNPTYRFWIQPPGGSWEIARDYSKTNTFNWTGSGAAGTYRTEVDALQQTSSLSYDAVFNLTYAVTGCSGASLTPNLPSPQSPGTALVLTGSANCPGTAEYRFWEFDPGSRWSMVRDYSPTATWNFNTAGLPFGSYALEVDVRDHGGTAAYESVANITYVLGCPTPTLTASPSSPGSTGSAVSFTASSSCANPLYRFWIAPPGGAWSIAQDYSRATTFNWAGTGATGTYRVEVDVRDQASPAAYDSVTNLTYVVAGCTSAGMTTNKGSPQPTGTAMVAFTGSATCPGTPDYRFWMRAPGGSWSIVRDYSPTATLSWNTANLPAGAYAWEVDVRDHGVTDSYEKVFNMTYTLAACTGATLTPDKPSPQPAGTPIVLTGSASCLGTPQYRFWMRVPGGAWTIVQDYSPSATLNWTTTGKPAGTYNLEVDVRNTGSTAVYETVANVTYVLN
jgi:hypothetical protein